MAVVKRCKPLDSLIHIFGFGVHLIVTCTLDDEKVLLIGRELEQRLAIPEGEGRSEPATHNNLKRLRQQLRDKIEGVEAQHQTDSSEVQAVGGVLGVPRRSAIELHRIEKVRVLNPCFFGVGQTAGDPRIATRFASSGLRGPMLADCLERLPDRIRRGLGLAECAAYVDRDDRADRFEARLGKGGVDRIPASRADTQNTHATLVNIGQSHQKIERAAYVLHAGVRVFQIARFATTFALVRRIVCEGYETLLGHLLAIDRANLLLDAAAGRNNDKSSIGSLRVEPGRKADVAS